MRTSFKRHQLRSGKTDYFLIQIRRVYFSVFSWVRIYVFIIDFLKFMHTTYKTGRLCSESRIQPRTKSSLSEMGVYKQAPSNLKPDIILISGKHKNKIEKIC